MPDTLPIDLGRYSMFVPPDPFEDHVGPFYFRIAGDARQAGSVHCVLPTHPRHGNYAGGVHGGATLTFADYALCLVAGRAADGGTNSSFAMTVSIAVEFLDAGRIGPPLEARGEPLQVTGRLAFARGSITQEGRTIALWSGVCRHVARAKAMARKDEAAPALNQAAPQGVPAGFELLANASVYSRHIGPSYARKETDGASLIQPTLPHMCNSGGVLHGGYMMSFAEFGGHPRRGAHDRHGAEHCGLRRRISGCRQCHDAAHDPGRGAAPRQVARLHARTSGAGWAEAAVLFGDDQAQGARLDQQSCHPERSEGSHARGKRR